VAETDPATRAILNTFPGAGGPDDVDRVQRVFLRYFNAHYQTYGREVVFVDVRQSGEPGDEAAMRADAQRVVEEVGAFAVMLGPGGRPSPYFVDELGARGGICVGCAGWPFWRSAYTRYPGSLWQVLGPPLDEYYAHVAEYIGKRLARQRAEWAGDPTFTSSERRFGLIWMDGDLAGPHPEAKKSRDFFLSELARYRVTIAGEASYVWDLARTQEQATSVIAKMKQAGVTSVACFCDGITAIFFTREATRQLYFPEWIITGVRQMDAVVTGRAFDQAQWRHAFGISAVPVPAATRSLEVMYRAYRHMIPDAQPDDVRGGAIADYSVLETVFTGIHMAGPHLTTQAFAAALYDYPPTGGTAIEPLMDYTPQSPASVNDFTELWWDPEARGTDETGIDGEGMYRRVDSGRRYPLGGWPSSPPRAFQIEGSVITTDDPPPGVAHEQDGHTHPEDQRCLSCQ